MGAEERKVETSVVALDKLPIWPNPPPSPPSPPPPPPPVRMLNATTDQLECQFEQGIDLTVTADTSGAAPVYQQAHAADTQQQCCALCALRADCSRFVFIPGSGACALLPRVPNSQLLRISNPATVAGTVFIIHSGPPRPERKHASCTYEVGRAFAKGALGAGRPLDRPQSPETRCCRTVPGSFSSSGQTPQARPCERGTR